MKASDAGLDLLIAREGKRNRASCDRHHPLRAEDHIEPQEGDDNA